MEIVLNIDPTLFLEEENTLRKYLPFGFIRHLVKWIPVYPDKPLCNDLTSKSDILCITDQGYLIQFDSNKTIVRTCNLKFEKLPTKNDKLELLKFLSSNSEWYVAILFQNTCYIYEQDQMSFKLFEVKSSVISITADDFMLVGSQQLKLIFKKHTGNDLIIDFNPVSPIYNKENASNVPNTKVLNSLSFQIEKSKQSLTKARKEVNQNEESITSYSKILLKNIDTQFIRESELVGEVLGKDKFKNVKNTSPSANDADLVFQGLKTQSFTFQFCGQPLLVHTLEFSQPNEWRVTGASSNIISKQDDICLNKIKVINNIKSFTKTESLNDIISSIYAEQKSRNSALEQYHCIVQQFTDSLIYSHVGKIETFLEMSNSAHQKSIKMPVIDLKDEIELENLSSNMNNENGEIVTEKLYGILTLMKKNTVRISSIASELPSAFSACLKDLGFQTSSNYPNLYYSLSSHSHLKGIIVIMKNEKPLKLKVDLFAVNENVLKVFVMKCYSTLPQDCEINMISTESKMKGSKFLKQKNCLIKEVNLLNSLLEHQPDTNIDMKVTPIKTKELETIESYSERKRKFETRNTKIDIPLQKFFDFQSDMEILEKDSDLALT